MDFGIIVIGDELLTGKRRDQHFTKAIETLSARNLDLKWCTIIGDDPALITDTLRRALNTQQAVFCFGGIGATPDDHTRQCAADAAGVALVRHPDAVAEIETRFGDSAYPYRILMAELPQSSRIIPNPYNRIPGFSLNNIHFLPGFPVMAWPMMNWVLDTYYSNGKNRPKQIEQTITVTGVYESNLMDIMQDFVKRFPRLRLSSLPAYAEEGPLIELGVRGDADQVPNAMGYLKQSIEKAGIDWRE
jgi:molybdopterin-biosynthesis enzyme MoeA-like protein